jgi:hypothetical protein
MYVCSVISIISIGPISSVDGGISAGIICQLETGSGLEVPDKLVWGMDDYLRYYWSIVKLIRSLSSLIC